MDLLEWLKYGIENKFCSPQFCEVHDGAPLSETEIEICETGDYDVLCLPMVRLGTLEDWENDAVEAKALMKNEEVSAE